jgi:hypothetical protein
VEGEIVIMSEAIWRILSNIVEFNATGSAEYLTPHGCVHHIQSRIAACDQPTSLKIPYKDCLHAGPTK